MLLAVLQRSCSQQYVYRLHARCNMHPAPCDKPLRLLQVAQTQTKYTGEIVLGRLL